MKVTPILFSGPMVRAILAGKKKQTRRAVKPQYAKHIFNVGGKASLPEGISIPCAYGHRGDLLWVRETTGMCGSDVVYKAGPSEYAGVALNDGKWKPSIFMPKAVSRLTLLLTGVHVERLHDISEADAVAEGCESTVGINKERDDYTGFYATEHYANLWKDINGEKSWDANPWVWVLHFCVYPVNINRFLKEITMTASSTSGSSTSGASSSAAGSSAAPGTVSSGASASAPAAAAVEPKKEAHGLLHRLEAIFEELEVDVTDEIAAIKAKL